MSKDCTCDTCKGACTNKPGWFKPGEVEKVALHLNISLQELFETKLGVDWWVAEDDIFVLAPATLSMDPGSEYPANPRGHCIFYENGLCSIHPVKPFECREYIHDEDKNASNKRHLAVSIAWESEQTQVTELLGRQATAAEADVFSALSWLY